MVERQRAGKHRVDDAAKAPDVARKRIGLFLKNFRRHVAKSAERFSRCFVRPDNFREAEINHFRHAALRVVAHHYVLKLQVSVNDTEAMQVFNGLADLIGQLLNSFLLKLKPTLLYVVKHVLACHKVKHDIVLVTAVENVNQLDDVRMLAHL